jgi:hypothetical protein
VPIGGLGRWQAVDADKQDEDFVGRDRRSRCKDVTATKLVLLGSIKATRLHEMKVLPRARHRHVEEPAVLVDLLGVCRWPCPRVRSRSRD